jgi:hypothetical protein
MHHFYKKINKQKKDNKPLIEMFCVEITLLNCFQSLQQNYKSLTNQSLRKVLQGISFSGHDNVLSKCIHNSGKIGKSNAVKNHCRPKFQPEHPRCGLSNQTSMK